jgi:regulator of protease activity HflC (stomatin/prohibitin superfamily)
MLQERLDRYAAGVEVMQVKLLDVHPSVEVVDAFRDVSGAFEEKNRLINEAEGYRNEQVAIARGNAEARLETAKGYSIGRENRADGDAGRFLLFEEAYRTGAGVNDLRLYLETMEEILPGKKKMIIDSSKAHRQLMLLDNGIDLAPASPAVLMPQRQRPLEEQ